MSLAISVGQHVDGVIRVVTLCTLAGTLAAYRRYQRRPETDRFLIVTRWSAAGLVLGVLIEVMIEVVRSV